MLRAGDEIAIIAAVGESAAIIAMAGARCSADGKSGCHADRNPGTPMVVVVRAMRPVMRPVRPVRATWLYDHLLGQRGRNDRRRPRDEQRCAQNGIGGRS